MYARRVRSRASGRPGRPRGTARSRIASVAWGNDQSAGVGALFAPVVVACRTGGEGARWGPKSSATAPSKHAAPINAGVSPVLGRLVGPSRAGRRHCRAVASNGGVAVRVARRAVQIGDVLAVPVLLIVSGGARWRGCRP